MSPILQSMTILLRMYLAQQSPVLSGNMKSGIEIDNFDEHQTEIVINAPFYDMKEWLKTRNIVYTGSTKYGSITDYAEWVNRLGAFGTHNGSEGWVNRAVVDVVRTVAAQYQIPDSNIVVMI